jgi:uncharacterized protein
LVEHLRGAGHDVLRLVRHTPPSGPGHGSDLEWNPVAGRLPIDAIDGVDAVINLSGAGIGDHRWTDSYRAELRSSRIVTTQLLASTIAAAARPPSVLLSGSAVGWYGARGDEILDEQSSPGSGFLADLCADWEAATAPAVAAGVRTVHLRTGIVLTPRGGALKKQLPLFKLGLGGRFGSGRQWQSWISLDDEVGAIEHLLTSSLAGAVNLTAPVPVTNREFGHTLGSVLKRPSVLPIPAFGPKLLLGADVANTLLFTGQRVVPSRLLDDGYSFTYSTLDAALRGLLER